MSVLSVFPAGGGAKLKITSYANVGSLPESAAEGALAVITSTAIGDVYVSADEPGSPSSGDGWVWIGGESLAPIALTDLFTVHPRACYQYDGSDWILLESYVYTDSEWVELTLYVYEEGDYLLASDASQVAIAGEESVITEYPAYWYLKARSPTLTTSYACVGFDTPIDLTNVSSIKMDINHVFCAGTSCTMRIAISANRSTTLVAYASSNAAGIKTLTLDVSAYTGSYYIMLYASGNPQHYESSANVYKVYLER